ncbi:MAG TPA: hypothetical protein VK835_13645 [Bacteroidia bacterium]|nr:hypothetical protein [Bacteroidia bacterium]
MQNFYAQKIIFTKGSNYNSSGKKVFYTLYAVDGKTYTIYKPRRIYVVANPTGLISYYVGYDSLNPQHAKVYYNMPFFNNTQSYPTTTSGKVILAKNNFCEFQFYAIDNLGVKKLKIAWQSISDDELKNNNVKPGTCFNVQYLAQNPEASIIYFNQPATNNQINWQKPELSKPNGLNMGFETNLLFTNPVKINRYLANYGQPQIKNVLPYFMLDYGWQYKSGFSWSLGWGGASKLFMGKLGIGYLQKINRRIYINTTLNFSNMSYSRPAFKNPQYQTLADTARFTYTNWFFNPKIDLMWRISKNNSHGCTFLKFGAGVFCDLNPNRKWVYQTGYTSTVGKSGKTTAYKNDADINSLPPFTNYMVYISVGIVIQTIYRP